MTDKFICIKGDERIITYDFHVAVGLRKDGYAVYREIKDKGGDEDSS